MMTAEGPDLQEATAEMLPVPLLLVPGTLCDERVFTPLFAYLPHRSIQIVALPRTESMAEMAAQILAAAPPRFALIGLSLGGIVGLEIAAQAPERLAGLALIGSNARPAPTDTHDARRAQAKAGGARLADHARETLAPLYAGRKVADHAAFERLVVDMAVTGGADALCRQTEAALSRADSRPRLAGIAMPVAVIGGSEDRLGTPEMQREMAAAIPAATLRLLDGVGHLAPVEAPEEVAAELIDWLGRVDRTIETNSYAEEEQP